MVFKILTNIGQWDTPYLIYHQNTKGLVTFVSSVLELTRDSDVKWADGRVSSGIAEGVRDRCRANAKAVSGTVGLAGRDRSTVVGGGGLRPGDGHSGAIEGGLNGDVRWAATDDRCVAVGLSCGRYVCMLSQ